MTQLSDLPPSATQIVVRHVHENSASFENLQQTSKALHCLCLKELCSRRAVETLRQMCLDHPESTVVRHLRLDHTPNARERVVDFITDVCAPQGMGLGVGAWAARLGV